MLTLADFDETFNMKTDNADIAPKDLFVGSYPPVTPAGKIGPFLVNTYFLRPGRALEVVGPVPVRNA